MSPAPVIALPEHYKWVALSAGGIALECFFLGFFYINSIRGKTFTKDFMKNEFADLANVELGRPPANGGYPDTGNGMHTDKLSFDQWFKFNTAMRGHLNFVENLPLMAVLVLLAGFYYPIGAAIIGLILFISRIVYILGYIAKPQLRFFGFVPMNACLATLIILTTIGVCKQIF